MSTNVAALIIVALALAINVTSAHADGRAPTAAADPELVSVSMSGDAAHGLSPAISGDGRYVAFWSSSGDIVPEDTNGLGDLFVYDRVASMSTRVNVSADGEQKTEEGGGHVEREISLSADGRFAVFKDYASHLVPGGDQDRNDIFVRDLQSGAVERVSVSSDGAPANPAGSRWPDVSGDGRFVVFSSVATNLVPGDNNDTEDIFVHDRESKTVERVSVSSDGTEANDGGIDGAISHDGRYVAFSSGATNLAPDDTNGTTDVFVRDRETGTTERVSVGFEGSEASGESRSPDISADGRFVAFVSTASNLVPDGEEGQIAVYVRDRKTGDTERVIAGVSDEEFGSKAPAISGDGRVVAFESTVYDRLTGLGQQIGGFDPARQIAGSDPALSDDGRYVAFVASQGPDPFPVSVYVYDRLSSPTELPPTGGATAGTGLYPALLLIGLGLALAGSATVLIALRASGDETVIVGRLRRREARHPS